MLKITDRTKFILALVVLFFTISSCGIVKDIVKEISGEDEKNRERLMKEGVSAEGEITKVEDTNVTINKNPQVRLYIRVKPKDGEEFDAVVKRVVSRVQIPRKGDYVKVWYNPKDKTDITVE